MDLSRRDYDRDCFPRYGTSNPEPVDSKLWRQLLGGNFKAARTYGHTDYNGHWSRLNRDNTSERRNARPGPRWFGRGRYGQSITNMPDGRTIYIGGAFEDFYDPDFCIYNDVIVKNTNETFDIYLYPLDIFPPTDFHSATRIGHKIYVIGGLGYVDLRCPGETPVLKLDTQTFLMEKLEIAGYAPGWLYEHTASYEVADHSIDLCGGEIITSDHQKIEPFEQTVTLDLETFRWC